jgi:hypothetical protein
MLAAVGFGCWGVVSQCCSSHHHQTSTIHPTSRCSWRWRGVVPVPARLVPPFAISSPVPPPASSFHPLSTPRAVARGARGGWCSPSHSLLLLLLLVVLFPHRPPVPPPASSFHPLSTPRAVARGARGGWCSPSRSPLLLLLVVVLFPHRPPVPPPASSFHPLSTPRAVAREARGGWCSLSRSPLLLLLVVLFPPRRRRLVPPLRRRFVVSSFRPPTPPRRRRFVSPPPRCGLVLPPSSSFHPPSLVFPLPSHSLVPSRRFSPPLPPRRLVLPLVGFPCSPVVPLSFWPFYSYPPHEAEARGAGDGWWSWRRVLPSS